MSTWDSFSALTALHPCGRASGLSQLAHCDLVSQRSGPGFTPLPRRGFALHVFESTKNTFCHIHFCTWPPDCNWSASCSRWYLCNSFINVDILEVENLARPLGSQRVWQILNQSHGKLARGRLGEAYAVWDSARRRCETSLRVTFPKMHEVEKRSGQAVPSTSRTRRPKALVRKSHARRVETEVESEQEQNATEEEGPS